MRFMGVGIWKWVAIQMTREPRMLFYKKEYLGARLNYIIERKVHD